jgi:hypothetical protein
MKEGSKKKYYSFLISKNFFKSRTIAIGYIEKIKPAGSVKVENLEASGVEKK